MVFEIELVKSSLSVNMIVTRDTPASTDCKRLGSLVSAFIKIMLPLTEGTIIHNDLAESERGDSDGAGCTSRDEGDDVRKQRFRNDGI